MIAKLLYPNHNPSRRPLCCAIWELSLAGIISSTMSHLRGLWSVMEQSFPPPFRFLNRHKPRRYVQHSLQDPDNTIRILYLLPGIEEQPLKCGIMEVPLVTAPEYDAISYHWGDPTPTHTLWIGPYMFPIPTSIYEALQRVRDDTVWKCLWIDGVCISQTDLDEKSRQILLLRQIFQQARHVLIWLGPQMNGSQAIPSFFEKIYLAQQAFHERIGGDVTDQHYAMLPRELYHTVGLPDETNLIWDIIPLFFGREWFTRVWVIQEVVLARDPIVVCGHWQMSWQQLLRVMTAILRLDLPRVIGAGEVTVDDYKVADAMRLAKFINALRYSLSVSYNWEFVHLVHRLRIANATDDRDKIYGLYGLASAFGHDVPKPDYSIDTGTLYKEFARKTIAQGNGVFVLYSCSYSSDESLPSWIPDWKSKPFSRPGLTPEPQQLTMAAHSARAGISVPSEIQLHDEDDCVLVVKGVIVEMVSVIGITIPLHLHTSNKNTSHDATPMVEACAIELENFWSKNSSESVYSAIGQERDEVIWRTLLLDRPANSWREAPAIYGRYYRTFRTQQSMASRTSETEISTSESRDATTNRSREVLDSESGLFTNAATETCETRRRCSTVTGRLGQVPIETLPGDVIFVPCGSAIPFVLRMNDLRFRMVGECYIHGIMKGEVFNDTECQIVDIELV